jgi:FixJ family two-component response regulator
LVPCRWWCMRATSRSSSEPSVIIVDDDAGVCDALAALVGSVGLMTRTFSTAEDFLSRWSPTGPACLVLDVRMPGMNGIELQRHLRGIDLPIPVILMSGHGSIPTAVAGIKAGAVDFLEKPFHAQDLLDRIDRHLEDSRRQWPHAMHRREVRKRLEQLTAREREVAEHVLRGGTNKLIARELGISVKTVDAHRTRLMRKLGVRNTGELLRDLLSLPELKTTD